MSREDVKEKAQTTHFGFNDVPLQEKAGKVAEVFHSVAGKYDIMNDLMSFGIHRIWKRIAIEHCQVRPGQRILDLAGGTGDLAALLAPKTGGDGLVVLSDINESMLSRGRERLLDQGVAGNVVFAQADAESLPFPDNSFDLITIAFGLRNVTLKDKALGAMFRALRPGGRLMVLEFSRPVLEPLRRVYDIYSFNVLPKIGNLVAGDEESYRYLAESIRMHPDQETLREMMREQGFENCRYFNMSGGIVAIHEGWKY